MYISIRVCALNDTLAELTKSLKMFKNSVKSAWFLANVNKCYLINWTLVSPKSFIINNISFKNA